MVTVVRAWVPFLLLATACPIHEPANTDGGTTGGGTTGGGTTGGGTTGGDASSSTEAVTDSAGSTGAVGECSFELVPEGGTVTACGIRLSLPPGAVAGPATVTVTQPALDAATAEGLVQSSPVFRLATDDPNLELAAYATLHVPHTASAQVTWMGRHFEEFGAWGVQETCYRDAEWTGIRTTLFGTFTALEDLADNDAKGAGSISATWKTRMESFPFDGLGHAHYVPSASGARSVDLYGVTTANGDPETLKLNFVIEKDGTVDGALISMAFVEQGVLESWIDWEGISPPSDVVLEVMETAPNHLVGSFAGTLYKDDAGTWLEMQVQANFEADMVRHFLPTEDPCPIP